MKTYINKEIYSNMQTQLKSKKGAHVKEDGFNVGPASTGTPGKYPGGYRGYMYVRAAPSSYEKTAQQKKIADAAKACALDGKYKREFGGSMQECIRAQFRK